MDRILPFRRNLTDRLLRAALVTLSGAPIAASVACGTSGTGGAGGTTGTSMTCDTKPVCFTWPDSGTTASVGSTSVSGSSTASGSSSTTSTGTGMMSACPAVGMTPASWNLTPPSPCAVVTGPITMPGMCCYQYVQGLGTGRPFIAEEASVVAPSRQGRDGAWTSGDLGAPRTIDLTDEERAALADAWTKDAMLEHASIASFGRFALELLAVGAPAELIERAHRAALEEVRHVRLCLSLASGYAGRDIEPDAFPFRGSVDVERDLATIAARAAREGCIGETLAALEAAERGACATDPAAREALLAIASDESEHAELAWRTVAWAVRTGGAPVRDAVLEVFAALGGSSDADDADDAHSAAVEDPVLLAHGVLSAAHRASVVERGVREVVRPAMTALIAAA